MKDVERNVGLKGVKIAEKLVKVEIILVLPVLEVTKRLFTKHFVA